MKARECSIFRLRKVLRDSDAGLKGIAVMEPQPQSDRTVKLRVEYVYQDRNEAQTFLLEKQKRAGDFPYGIV